MGSKSKAMVILLVVINAMDGSVIDLAGTKE